MEATGVGAGLSLPTDWDGCPEKIPVSADSRPHVWPVPPVKVQGSRLEAHGSPGRSGRHGPPDQALRGSRGSSSAPVFLQSCQEHN